MGFLDGAYQSDPNFSIIGHLIFLNDICMSESIKLELALECTQLWIINGLNALDKMCFQWWCKNSLGFCSLGSHYKLSMLNKT